MLLRPVSRTQVLILSENVDPQESVTCVTDFRDGRISSTMLSYKTQKAMYRKKAELGRHDI